MTSPPEKPAPRKFPVRKGAHPFFIIAFVAAAALAIRGVHYIHPPLVAGMAGAPGQTGIPAGMQAGTADATLGGTQPQHLSGKIAMAQEVARKWRPNAELVEISVDSRFNFAPVYNFLNPPDQNRLNVIEQNNSFSTSTRTAGGPIAPITGKFIDLPEAVDDAQKMGMQKDAMTRAALSWLVSGGQPVLVWTLHTAIGRTAQIFYINASTGQPQSIDKSLLPAP